MTSGTERTASTIASILAASRPSEKFGTHSTSCLPKQLSSINGRRHQVHPEVVRDLAIVVRVEYYQVAVFSFFDGANAACDSQCVRSVDGGGGDRFRGRHAHLGTRERQDHRHADRRTGARIVIRREG